MTRAGLLRASLAAAAFSLAIGATGVSPLFAQTLSEKLGKHAKSSKPDEQNQMLLRADSMVYDNDHNTVGAEGHVQIYYQGRVLQADKVTYNRNTNRVFAEGHAKLTEQDGSVAYGDRFELTQDLKSGFIDSLHGDTADNTHFTAARAERSEGETTVLERGAYTACEPCKEHPEKPPLWQIRAAKIIHKNAEQTVYYEDATLEFYGVPLMWLPYFSTPDPSVKRKTGVLAPTYALKTELGFGVSVPVFINLAPNYDLTLTPTFYTRQGLMLDGEWRQRFANGAYNVRTSGIFQADPSAFNQFPYGAGDRSFRGSLQSIGQFNINDKWKYGWNVSLSSDKYFNQDYRQTDETLATNFFKQSESTAYLTGQGAQSLFDLRGYYFQSLATSDLQRQQPIVAPVLSYNRMFNLDPKDTKGIGGEVTIDASFSNIESNLANYQSAGSQSLDQAFGLYNVCQTAGVPTYKPGSCLLRGIAGDYANATVTASWQRKFIDPIGEVWTPFAFMHASGSFLNLNTSGSQTFSSSNGSSTITNASQTNFLGDQNNNFTGEAVPGVGTEWRYPFIARTGAATSVLEPIAQIIVRPNEPVNAAQVNLDAQSLVFDDTNLFEWNRFSGNDRFEGGTRLNYGAQYALTMDNGGYANLMFGQSYQLGGRNSYAIADMAATGLQSGLDTRWSDYVARVQYSPNSHLSFIAKADLDPTTFTRQRLDLMANAVFGNLEGSIQYARYEAQPQIGYYVPREGLATTAKFKISPNYFLTGNITFDLSRHFYNNLYGGNAPLFAVAGVGLGAGYTNDCATIAVNYSSTYETNLTGPATRDQTVLLSLQLRTLGDTEIRSGLPEVSVTDGLATAH